MKKITLVLVCVFTLTAVASPAFASKAPAMVLAENGLYGAALGAITAVAIGLIGGNLSTAPYSSAMGIGIIAGMGLGLYEVTNHQEKYTRQQVDQALADTEISPCLRSLNLISTAPSVSLEKAGS